MDSFRYQEQGKSNCIIYKTYKGREIIQKNYQEKLKDYDVLWPISRKSVEYNSHRRIASLCSENHYFHQPRLFHELDSQTTLSMEYISAPSILKIICSDEYRDLLPDVHFLEELISLLYAVNSLTPSDLLSEEMELLQKQTEIVNCMYHNKLQDRVPLPKDQQLYFCLGDVSLNNILFDGQYFTLLDFECAHMGYRGYDIGQLLGMADACSRRNEQAIIFYQNLKSAFENTISDGDRNRIEIWASRFAEYYRNTAGSKPGYPSF